MACRKILDTIGHLKLWYISFETPLNTVDSAYNIHGYKGQPVIVATKIISQIPY